MVRASAVKVRVGFYLETSWFVAPGLYAYGPHEWTQTHLALAWTSTGQPTDTYSDKSSFSPPPLVPLRKAGHTKECRR